MRIVIVSDTHMPRMAKKLPEPLIKELINADAILHAGDWTKLSVYEELVKFAPVDGVAGNNDGQDIIERFGYQKVLMFGGYRIGVVHGHGTGKGDTETKSVHAFEGQNVDVIVFGHSHIPVLKKHNGVLLFNPGSPTDKRRQLRFSFGIIDLSESGIHAKHLFYDSKM